MSGMSIKSKCYTCIYILLVYRLLLNAIIIHLATILLHIPLNFMDISRNRGQVTELFRHITESFNDSPIQGTWHGTIMVNLTDFPWSDGKHGNFHCKN